ncbi:hypothetical protein C8Q76DRAFT_216052 [Earliella scabrosa]|nr:hypothetical protein C8Q76DRAFT_216052 [Earliella scabrosa]
MRPMQLARYTCTYASTAADPRIARDGTWLPSGFDFGRSHAPSPNGGVPACGPAVRCGTLLREGTGRRARIVPRRGALKLLQGRLGDAAGAQQIRRLGFRVSRLRFATVETRQFDVHSFPLSSLPGHVNLRHGCVRHYIIQPRPAASARVRTFGDKLHLQDKPETNRSRLRPVSSLQRRCSQLSVPSRGRLARSGQWKSSEEGAPPQLQRESGGLSRAAAQEARMGRPDPGR